MSATETYCLLISSDVADRWKVMNVTGELTSVLRLRCDICCASVWPASRIKRLKACSNTYKLQQINHVTKCLVQLICNIRCFIIQFFSVATEAVYSVLTEQKRRKFKYSFYKQTNKDRSNVHL